MSLPFTIQLFYKKCNANKGVESSNHKKDGREKAIDALRNAFNEGNSEGNVTAMDSARTLESTFSLTKPTFSLTLHRGKTGVYP